jgi:hypothetical protein
MTAHDGDEAEKAQDKSSHDSRDFHHPYTPYSIQETFMSTVYQVLEDGKVGILESPTGTVSFSLHSIHVIFASPLERKSGILFTFEAHALDANRPSIRASH